MSSWESDHEAKSGTKETESETSVSGSWGCEGVCDKLGHSVFRRLPVFSQLTLSSGEDADEGERHSFPAHAGLRSLLTNTENHEASVSLTTRHPVTSLPPAKHSSRARRVTAGMSIFGTSEHFSAEQCSALGSSVLSPAEQCSTLEAGDLFSPGPPHRITSQDSTMPWDGSPEGCLALRATAISTDSGAATRSGHIPTSSATTYSDHISAGSAAACTGHISTSSATTYSDHISANSAAAYIGHISTSSATTYSDHISASSATTYSDHMSTSSATSCSDYIPTSCATTRCDNIPPGGALSVVDPNFPGADQSDIEQLLDHAREGTEDATDKCDTCMLRVKVDGRVPLSHTATDCVSNVLSDREKDSTAAENALNVLSHSEESNPVCVSRSATNCGSNGLGNREEDNVVRASHTVTDCASECPTDSDLRQLEQDMDIDVMEESLGARGNDSGSSGDDSGCEDDVGHCSDMDDTEAEWSSPVFIDLQPLASDLLSGERAGSHTNPAQRVMTYSLPSCVMSACASPLEDNNVKDTNNVNSNNTSKITSDTQTTNAVTSSAVLQRPHSTSQVHYVEHKEHGNSKRSDDDIVKQSNQESVYNKATHLVNASSQVNAESQYSNCPRDHTGAEEPERDSYGDPMDDLCVLGEVEIYYANVEGDLSRARKSSDSDTDDLHVNTGAVKGNGMVTTNEDNSGGARGWKNAGETGEDEPAGDRGDKRGRGGETTVADDSTNDGLSSVDNKPATCSVVSARPRLVCSGRKARKDKADHSSQIITPEYILQNPSEVSSDAIPATDISDVIEMQEDSCASDTETNVCIVTGEPENSSDVSKIRTKSDVTDANSGKSDVIDVPDRRRALKRPFINTFDVDAIIRILQQCDLC